MKSYVIVLGLFLLLPAATDVSAGDDTPAAREVSAAPDRIGREQGDYLIGSLSRAQWEAFDETLRRETTAYEPNPDLAAALAGYGGEARVLCVLGTWCSDSRREVPRFWKVLEAAGLYDLPVELIAVGPASDPAASAWEAAHGVGVGVRERYGVQLVPTFIVYEGDAELGRIVETPEISIEADLAGILGVNASPSWH